MRLINSSYIKNIPRSISSGEKYCIILSLFN
nr:MAG TPA: hypothetical protein [Caudoviricetes sp.]DAW68932.1 MAG TPA: hypothetical protein [Caudoviricetes sp.]